MAAGIVEGGAGDSQYTISGDPSGEVFDEVGTPFQPGVRYGVYDLMRTVDWLRTATIDAHPELVDILQATPDLVPIYDAYIASKDSAADGSPPGSGRRQ
jgi:hypothetical protein